MSSDARLEPLVLALLTLLLSYVVYYFALRSSGAPDIPILNAWQGEFFPRFRAVWRNTFDLVSALILNTEQFKD